LELQAHSQQVQRWQFTNNIANYQYVPMAEISRQDLLEVLQGGGSSNSTLAAAAEAAAVTQTQHKQLEQHESDRDSWKVRWFSIQAAILTQQAPSASWQL
jgi:hypothetical protein